MEKIFGTWYENKLLDASIKTVILVFGYISAVWVYNLFGGTPKIDLKEYYSTLWKPLAAIIVIGFLAFYYAASAHRKYRHHLSQRAQVLSMRLRERKKRR